MGSGKPAKGDSGTRSDRNILVNDGRFTACIVKPILTTAGNIPCARCNRAPGCVPAGSAV